ncbi:MAG TPA: CPBP family intramembrane glutamic endopeptidase [Bacteroidota bacterium]|nr:CPBP family intramembrane glutamic endopeptidase [Bacteroidota bacterium]
MDDATQDLPPVSPGGVPAEPEGTFLQRMHPVVFCLFALALIFVLYQLVGGFLTLLVARWRITEANVTIVRWATILGQLLFILAPTVWLARKRHGPGAALFRVKIPRVRDLAATMLAVFALQQMMQAYMVLQDRIPLPDGMQQFLDWMRRILEETERLLVQANSPGEFIFVIVVVALVPALAEELLFRGLVQRNLEAVSGWWGAVITGVVFGIYHFNPFTLVPLVALGVYFGFIVYRSGNITLSMSAHFFNNFVACAAMYLHLDDNFVAVSPSSAPTLTLAAWNFAGFAVVFCAATLYFVHSTGHASGEST